MKLFTAKPRCSPKANPVGHLRITPTSGVAVDVPTESVVIGRDRTCDLQLDDDQVNERHAEIYSVGNVLWLRDLGSDDGTYLNGEIVETAPIDVPSEVRLGSLGPILSLRAVPSGTVA